MDNIRKLLFRIPIVLLSALADVFIVSAIAQMIFFQMLDAGYNHITILIVSVIVMLITYTYIRFNHKIKDLAKEKGDEKQ